MKKTTLIPLLLLVAMVGFSQSRFVLPNNSDTEKIRFKFVNNLIIIPVEINGAKLSFLLDSGVRKPIIFNLFKETDSLILRDAEVVYLKGLGEGNPVKALRSENNIFKVGDALNAKQTMYAVFDENLNFSPRLGFPVHGIVGYDLFKDFIVEINYSKSWIKLHNPSAYKYKKCRKCQTFDLEFRNNKPYFNIEVGIAGKKTPVKLLIDSGGTDALWLFEDAEAGLLSGDNYFEDFLGHGLNGSVYGKRSRVDKVYLNTFELANVNVAFPDSTSVAHAKNIQDRNGSFSGELIKRFNVIMDYKNAKITLKKNKFFDKPFSYNKAGIELQQSGIRVVREQQAHAKTQGVAAYKSNKGQVNFMTKSGYKLVVKPAFSIVEIRKGSPADRIGLMVGDVIISVNGKATQRYTLQKVLRFFYDEAGKRIRLKVERQGIPLTFVFRLEDPLK